MEREKRETRRQKIRQQKRRRVVAWLLVVILAVLVIFGLIKLLGWIFTPKYVASANIGPNPVAEGAVARITPAPRYYDYASPVPDADAVEDSHFSSALMIGQSRLSGFPLYNYLTAADYLTGNVVNVGSVESYEFDFDGGTTTLPDLLGSGQYDAVYIEFGLNEAGWYGGESFVGAYRSLISTIKSLSPNSSIYLNSIIPVTASASSAADTLTNENIADYNALIQDIATTEEVYFLNLTDTMSGGTGQLTSAYAGGDGVSLSKEGYNKWVDYLKTHVVNKELYS